MESSEKRFVLTHVASKYWTRRAETVVVIDRIKYGVLLLFLPLQSGNLHAHDELVVVSTTTLSRTSTDD